MRKLWSDGGKFINSEELKGVFGKLKVSYTDMVRYLLARGYLIRIFRGIFYVKSLEEVKFGRLDERYLNLVAEGLRIKGVERWYFGLYTALKLNKVTHEYFTVDFVVNDKIFRAKEIEISGYKFKFIKVKSELLKFGIKEKAGIRYSDLEKTILDFIYLWRYRGIPKEKILVDISEWVEKASPSKLKRYVKKYPKSVEKILERTR